MFKKIFYRENEIIQILNISKPTLYRMMQKGHFPKPQKLTNRTNVWLVDEVDEIFNSMVENIKNSTDKNEPIFNVC